MSISRITPSKTVRPSTTACQRLPVRRIVILPFPLFLYPRVISQASREHHFTTGDLSRPNRRCGLRDFAQMLAVAVDHGNHDSPRPSRRCRFSRRCRRGPLRRCRRCLLRRCRRCLLRCCRYLRNLIPLHCPLPPFGPSPKNSHHTRPDRIDHFIVCRSSDDSDSTSYQQSDLIRSTARTETASASAASFRLNRKATS
jgi:hypothetical protein